MLLENNSKILMIGDSITDCGRTRPRAVGARNLGDGYVSMLHDQLSAQAPFVDFSIVNAGISGNTIRDLKKRWEQDVLSENPNYVTMMIGVNDVWRRFGASGREDAVFPEEYQETMTELVSKTVTYVKKMVLISPFYFVSLKEDPFRAAIDTYVEIMEKVAKEHDCIFINTMAVFDKILSVRHGYWLSGDFVHPNSVGHCIIAKEISKVFLTY